MEPLPQVKVFNQQWHDGVVVVVVAGVSKDDTLSNASSCHSPASSEAGGIYTQELVENFALNLHR